MRIFPYEWLRATRLVLRFCLLAAVLLYLPGCMGGAQGTGAGDEPVSFTVQGSTAVMQGKIDRNTPTAMLDVMADNDSIKTISMQHVTGDFDYRANREAARMLYEYHLATHVPANGFISQEGLEFFLGGWKRTADAGAQIAVGSWFDGELYGVDLPRQHSLHFGYLRWYRDHGIPDDFYWFALKAAPKGQVHILTREEMVRFHIVTE